MIRFRSQASITLALLGAGSLMAQAQEPLRREVLAMGTRLTLVLQGATPSQLQTAGETALAEVARIEAAISTWREDSVFSRLNQAQGEVVSLAPEWLGLLGAAHAQAARTRGAFDPVMGALVEAWGLRAGGRRPRPEALHLARVASGYRHLRVEPARGEAWLLAPGARVEEGAFGKGYALDRMAIRLREQGITRGWLDFGGQVLALEGAPAIPVADPKDRQQPRLTVALTHASLSTSGCSQRGRHILDPRTGRPCADWGSASVVAPSAFEADCLSTALYVMGPRKGLRWATANRVAACFLLNDGRVHMTPAFRDLHPTTPKESS